jgi:hypothetical protein
MISSKPIGMQVVRRQVASIISNMLGVIMECMHTTITVLRTTIIMGIKIHTISITSSLTQTNAKNKSVLTAAFKESARVKNSVKTSFTVTLTYSQSFQL